MRVRRGGPFVGPSRGHRPVWMRGRCARACSLSHSVRSQSAPASSALQRARDLYARYAGPSVRERAAGGNVDWRQSTLPFLPLFSAVPEAPSARTSNSSGFAGRMNVTVRVLGGKNGNIAARNGKKWHGGWQKRPGCAGVRPHPRRQARGCEGMRWACLSLYAVVKVLSRRGGAAVIEPIYPVTGGTSRENPLPELAIASTPGCRWPRRLHFGRTANMRAFWPIGPGACGPSAPSGRMRTLPLVAELVVARIQSLQSPTGMMAHRMGVGARGTEVPAHGTAGGLKP